MRKIGFTKFAVAISIIYLIATISCNQIDEGHTPRTKDPTDLAYAKESIKNFSKIDINNNIDFEMGEADNTNATIKSSYKIAQYEVTRDLWSHVYEWATNESERGAGTYSFSTKANIGHVTSHKNEPMVNVSYMDAVVWCNAYTEYLNFLHKEEKSWVDLTPVYYTKENETRDAFAEFVKTEDKDRKAKYVELLSKYVLRIAGEVQNSKTGMEFNEFYEFNGYRLPTAEEWEFASRLTKTPSASYNTHKTVNISGSPYYLAKGLCLSGSIYTYDDNTTIAKEANAKVASNFDQLLKGPLPDSDNPPQVASKDANDIGCFDMSGGVWEWTLPEIDRHIMLKKSGKVFILDKEYPKVSQNNEGINRRKGGSYLSKEAKEYAVGFVAKFPMKEDEKDKTKWQKKDIGFRLAKTEINFF